MTNATNFLTLSKARRAVLFCSSALTLAVIPTSVFSQEETAPAGPSSGKIPTIVVTAQKKEQQVNSVPMSITAATGEQLARAGVREPRDLAKVTTSFNATDSILGTPIFTLRGVGFSDVSLGGRPTVSVYLDEVPIPFAIETRGANLDLERVEILKGPQGTLFGQNSTGGAVNYIAAKPTSEFEAGLDASYGRFNAVDVGGFLSGPITDTLSARASLEYSYMDDWQTSYTSGATTGSTDLLNGRIITVWEPIDSFSAQLTVGAYRDQSDTVAGQAIAIIPSDPTFAGDVAGLLTYPLAPADPRAVDFTTGEDYARDNSFIYANLRLDAELGENLTLTSLSSYSEYDEDRLIDTDGTALRNLDIATTGSIKSFSQELRLAGDISDIGDFVFGLNYTDDRVLETEILRNPESTIGFAFTPFMLPIFETTRDINNQDTESYAVFGNVNIDVTPEVRIYGGARYTNTKIDHEGCSADVGDGGTAASFTFLINFTRDLFMLAPIDPIAPGGCFTVDATLTPTFVQDGLDEDNVSWRAGLDWTPAPDLLFYANVSKGFKSGSFPTLAASATSQLEPVTQESLLAYEAGFKTQVLDGSMQFNGAVFHYDYTDKQIQGQFDDLVFGRLLRLVNIPDSRITGAEMDILWVPTDGLTITAGGSYIDSEIQGSFIDFDSLGDQREFAGERFPNTPKWHFVSDVDYRFNVGNGLGGFVGGGLTHQSATNSQLGELAVVDVRDRTLIDLRAGVEAEDGQWRVTVWGRNVGDQYYWESANTSLDTAVRYPGMPATYGVSVSLRR